MNPDTIRQSVDDTSRALLIAEPYFGHLLVGLVRTAAAGDFAARLVAAGHTPRLEVGAARWAALGSAKMRAAALKHELLHLTFKHPLRARDFARRELYGLACDLVVNQLLDPRELEAAATLDDFAELRLERDRTADHYYARLLPLYEQCARGGACEGASGAEAAMRRWLAASGERGPHAGWAGFAELPSATLSVLETNVDALLEATVRRARCRRWGRLPGRLLEYLAGLVDKKSEVPWRRVLRLFAATSERTYLKTTLARPSKRYGTSPGVRVRRKTDVVVAVDTSGSVDAEDLGLFFGEVHALWRRGASVVVLECDAEVRREYPYRGAPPRAAAGRGGTSFDPAIARANELRPDALVYFTDGFAPRTTVRARMPLLWVLSSAGCALDDAGHLPGRRIKLRRGPA